MGPLGAGRVVGGVFQAALFPRQSELFPRSLVLDSTRAPGGIGGLPSGAQALSSSLLPCVALAAAATLRASVPRGTNVSSQGGQAGWEVRGHGAPLPVPPRECPPAHQVVKRSQSMSSGGQVLHKKTDENKPEAASCVRAASAKRQQLLQGWAARPSREGDLGTESRSRGAARGGASTCEGPGQGGGPAGPGGRGGHRARAGQTQAGQASGASWCRTGHWRDT